MLIKEHSKTSDKGLEIIKNGQKVDYKGKIKKSPFKDAFRMMGQVSIDVVGKDGKVKESVRTHNRIVDRGLEMLASMLGGVDHTGEPVINPPIAMAIGSESTEVLASNTALVNEVLRKPFDTKIRANNNIEFTTTFLPNEPQLNRVRISEVGMFNSAEGKTGDMFNRAVFAVVNKSKDDTLIIRWTITFDSVPSEFDSEWDDETPAPGSSPGGVSPAQISDSDWQKQIDSAYQYTVNEIDPKGSSKVGNTSQISDVLDLSANISKANRQTQLDDSYSYIEKEK